MKNYLSYVFGTLFSNQNVLDGKKRKFYQSLIIVVLSLIFAILPVFVSAMNASGATILTKNNNASLDVSLSLFSKYLQEDSSVSFTTSNEGKFVVTGFVDKEIKIGERTALAIHVLQENESLTDVAKKYQDGITSEGKPSETPISFFIISEDRINICTFLTTSKNTLKEDGTIKKNASANGTYVGYAKTFKGQDFSTFFTSETKVDNVSGSDYCYNSWKKALNKMYEPYKTSTVLYSVGVYTAVNIVIVLIMALVLMLMSLLKKEKQSRINYLEALNCTNYASLTPSIIAMILGFIFSNFASISFVLCMGVRSVFLCSKINNPSDK